jgi:hypothetical protein
LLLRRALCGLLLLLAQDIQTPFIGTFREHSRNIQETFRNVQGIFKNVQGTFREHIGTFMEHIGNIEL